MDVSGVLAAFHDVAWLDGHASSSHAVWSHYDVVWLPDLSSKSQSSAVYFQSLQNYLKKVTVKYSLPFLLAV